MYILGFHVFLKLLLVKLDLFFLCIYCRSYFYVKILYSFLHLWKFARDHVLDCLVVLVYLFFQLRDDLLKFALARLKKTGGKLLCVTLHFYGLGNTFFWGGGEFIIFLKKINFRFSRFENFIINTFYVFIEYLLALLQIGFCLFLVESKLFYWFWINW
jgi:hypothetical protein